MGVVEEVGNGTHMDKNEVTTEINNNQESTDSTNNNTSGDNEVTKPTTKPNYVQTLPNTGDESSIALLGIAILSSIASFILMTKKRKIINKTK